MRTVHRYNRDVHHCDAHRSPLQSRRSPLRCAPFTATIATFTTAMRTVHRCNRDVHHRDAHRSPPQSRRSPLDVEWIVVWRAHSPVDVASDGIARDRCSEVRERCSGFCARCSSVIDPCSTPRDRCSDFLDRCSDLLDRCSDSPHPWLAQPEAVHSVYDPVPGARPPGAVERGRVQRLAPIEPREPPGGP